MSMSESLGNRLLLRPPLPSARHGRPAAGRRAVAAMLRHAIYGSALYRLWLGGGAPSELALTPSDPWPGDAARGDRLFQGHYVFAGYEITAPNRPVWLPAGANPAWLDEMHAFEWLRDFRANGGEAARRHARALITDWLLLCGRWHRQIWRADILGRRLAAWICSGPFLLKGADARFHKDYFAGLARQARHLRRTAAGEVEGARRLQAVRGLIYAAAALGGGERRLATPLRLLEREIDAQILIDGGHVERSPRLLNQVLAELADLRDLLLAADLAPPQALIDAIDRIAPVVRMLRHGDGGFGCFNGSGEETAAADATLALAGAKGKALDSAPHTGFQRIAAKRTLVLVDAGVPSAVAENVQAGTLGFELSLGRQRLVVNCGPHVGRDAAWSEALRSTAAHSTLTLKDTNSTQFMGREQLGRRPRQVTCERRQQDDAIWLDMSHDGYAAAFGLVHARRLYLDGDGADLRGEDRLVAADGSDTAAPGLGFAIRFHLHPHVRASLVQNGRAVLLRLRSGEGWQLRAAGGRLAVAPSVYFGTGEHRRTEQVVISGETGTQGAAVKWGLRRISNR